MENLLQSPLTGRTYSLIKIIGEGEYGTVWLVQRDDGLFYACKLLKPKFAVWTIEKSKKFEERANQEIQTLIKSTHVNVVRYEEWFQIQNSGRFDRYIISEYCEGGTLSKMLETKGRQSENDALHIMIQLADGLQYMHNQKIIHRDIKPANIMLKQGVPKYIDFGFAKHFEEEKVDQIQTVDVGSPQYMAPELLEESGYYNQKVDVWALGIIFYQLLVGQFPWNIEQATSYQMILNIILDDETIYFPPQIPISERIKQTIIQMLIINPDDRIDSNKLCLMLQN
ncbi:unnamed protein product (macronuclear) [Paramecium tetraurelia]|uniref:Protein kinase domain-containing protein n=1 Tax=Paramecium tetraurelia TaxID=5888 RepID=A0E505_PARTE|nr:uncharacterized protein GSPATT00023549001 [Paramecium tetraurelia]CAK90372.1 unnamed protein product [Paramecium tetraurelia]|eukprot:XP_001457769.1 hypothetical protein (macronuclear) [Paramecium tetraurelia strain d4-2]